MHNAVLHPTPQELTAFALGKLPEHAAASVAAHLDTCPACRQAVAAVPPDSFLDKVRAVKQDSSSFPPDLAEPDDALSSAGKSATPDVPCLNLPPELAHHPKYLILRELGRGGMGVVYQARHKEMDRLVVIKVINRALLDRPDSLERFRREIQAAAQLLHPNIVTAYDAEQAGDSHMLVMEFVPGRSLAEVVRLKGPLPTGIACYFARQIALGLQHAHERNMVHRDIKPLNLMLTPKGQIKILDFGLAKVVSERDTEKGLTETGAYMGTPDYCAPEQAEDARKADIRADLYSLGCTLYYLLAGRPPFQEDTAMKIYLAHREKQPQPLPELRKDVPAELWQVVKRLLAKDPAQRYQKPIEAAQALVPFIKSGAKQVAKGVSPLPQSVESPEKGTRIAADTRQLKLILREVPVKEPPKKVPAKEEASVIEVVEDAPALPKKTTKARESTKRVPAAWYRYRAVLIFAGVAALVVIGAIFIQATWNRWRFAQNQSEGTPQSLDNGQKSDNKVRLPRLKPPINIACQVGHSSEIAFEIERNDCRDQLMLRLEGLPPQVRQESAPAKDTDTLHVKLTIAADLKPQAIPVKLQLHVGDVVADTKALLLNIQKDALLKRPQEEQKPGVRLKDGTPQSLTIEPGKADGLKVLLERGNYAGEAKLHLDGLPAGAMTVPVTVPAGSSSATVTVETKAETQLGEHEAKLRLRVNEQTVDERNITLSVRRPRGRLEIVHFHTVDHMELAGTLYHGWKGKQGMTVLMLHDLGRDCSSPGWKYLAEALQAEGHTVLTFDFRGHGESKKISAAFWKFSVNRYLTSHDAALPAEKQP
ncbi:MAG TPA: protein kinase, partial [Gemmataceae bacterium]|nr:protein kinase [Gemmataceae bacterium]